MRATIYCRFSSEHQRESSIEDQARNCERFAAREGWQVVSRFQDKAISGTKKDRAGYQDMLSAAKRREFDVLLVDDLSRLSRDEIELKQTVRRFKFSGLRIVGVSDGFDTNAKGHKIQATVRGLINEIYLDDLAEKTHRGLTGRALAGFNAGGRSYGYRHFPIYEGTDEYGRPRIVAARREIDPDQALIIREIFELFIRGWSPRSIAQELNRRGIPAPRGGTWAFSAIYGDKVRSGVGFLNNPLYTGRVIWNRSEWVRDPDTGMRKRKERPPTEWIVREDEALRIVSQEFQRAPAPREARQDSKSLSRTRLEPAQLSRVSLRSPGPRPPCG
jgi:DNA invertase Pin-like site-specific DNA recombinase